MRLWAYAILEVLQLLVVTETMKIMKKKKRMTIYFYTIYMS